MQKVIFVNVKGGMLSSSEKTEISYRMNREVFGMTAQKLDDI